jgi:prephenate dehydrogenase
LGGSIGLGLRQAGFTGKIVGLGRRAESLALAKSLGCVDEIATDIATALRESQLVVLCSPVATFDGWFSRIAPECHPGMVITDVGSTKAEVCRQAAMHLGPCARRFVGSHPMAGGELGGAGHATADLFRGKPCILTPSGDADPAALAVVEALWMKLGMHLTKMTPHDHDWAVARISHLPHVVAAALMRLASGAGGLEIASSGFRDTTRVASGDPEIWRDIFATNRAAILEALDAYRRELGTFRDIIALGDGQKLMAALTDAQRARDAWLKTQSAGHGDDHTVE